MSEFCENCPRRGKIVGRVTGAYTTYGELRSIFGGVEQLGHIAVLFDVHRLTAEPVRAPSQNTIERLEARLDDCAAPQEERSGILRRRSYICPALQDLTIESDYVRETILKRAQAEIA